MSAFLSLAELEVADGDLKFVIWAAYMFDCLVHKKNGPCGPFFFAVFRRTAIIAP